MHLEDFLYKNRFPRKKLASQFRSRLSPHGIVVVSALMLSGWPVSTDAGWFSYDSYEDCMLGKMKGQDRSMYPTADRECKKLLKVEIEIPQSSIKWNFSDGDGETKITIEDSGIYEITSGVFRFSRKPCSEMANDEDFSSPGPVTFSQGVGIYKWSIWEQHCAKIDSLRGRYK